MNSTEETFSGTGPDPLALPPPGRPWLIRAVLWALAGAGSAALLQPGSTPSRVQPQSNPDPGITAPGPPAGVEVHLARLRSAAASGHETTAALDLAALQDPATIRALLENSRLVPPQSALLARATLLKRWLQLEPAGVLDYARLHDPGALALLLGTWSLTHPAEARNWIQGLPRGKTQTEAWRQLCAVTAASDLDHAWQLLIQSPAPLENRSRGIPAVLLQNALGAPDDGRVPTYVMATEEVDPAALADNPLLNSGPAREIHAWLDRQVRSPNPLLRVLARVNPLPAASWLETHVTVARIPGADQPLPPEQGLQAVAGFSAAWAAEDPEAAAAWAGRLSTAAEFVTTASHNVAVQYLRYAPQEARGGFPNCRPARRGKGPRLRWAGISSRPGLPDNRGPHCRIHAPPGHGVIARERKVL